MNDELKGLVIKIYPSSAMEEDHEDNATHKIVDGYEIDIFAEDDEICDIVLGGGFCTGSLADALDMATVEAKKII
jgi:hypothetical protein